MHLEWLVKALQGGRFNRAKLEIEATTFLLIGFAAFISALGETQSACCQESVAQPPLEMHRIQATTPGDGGWYLAESTHGSFSILIPIPFNDFTGTENDAKLGALKSYIVGAKRKDGMKFSAIQTPIVAGRTPRDLDQMLDRANKQGTKTSDVSKGTVSGWPSMSFMETGEKSAAYVRYVQMDTSVIIITLEFPIGLQSEAAKLKPRFLDSLKIKIANKQPAPDAKPAE